MVGGLAGPRFGLRRIRLDLAAHAVLGEILKQHKALVLTSFGGGFGVIGTLTLFLRLF